MSPQGGHSIQAGVLSYNSDEEARNPSTIWDKKNLESNRNSNICVMKTEFDPLYRPSQLKFGKIHNYIAIFTSLFS